MKMSTLDIALAAIAAAVLAVPGQAQQAYAPVEADDGGSATDPLSTSIHHLHLRLTDGERRGSIDPAEARAIGKRLELIGDLSALGDLSISDRVFLQRQVRAVRARIQRADNGANGRFADWDADDDYVLRPEPNAPIDANRDGVDDRDFNRNGFWEDDRQGLGAAAVPGSDLQSGALRVGQRAAPSDMFGVPYQHQDRYRDSEHVYYRSDGARIYQISRDSHKVTRIFRI
ncbi:hypothetical protein [Sphingomonas sp.]|uniref:hypothetical protein n=1 Tax=Sphingomonas sp. TaxID=28214 RepID=UPI00286EA6B1|nr:hypothetical protein [Sphingomonas sp.]